MINPDWWRGAVIYQIYLRSFFDSNGDGIGDLPGVTARLDHIASLGADALWLCPFFPSPQRDFGYDVSHHTAVDPQFGTLQDFDRLVARAHSLGLNVLIDQVWSHTSDRHPWFLESRTSRDTDRADWYVWADPAPDGTAPNNWLSVFGGPAWTWEPRRRQYYLHHFLSHQPALNLHNPAVMDALLETGAFWLDRGVDGFRLDAIDFLLHDEQFRSNPPAPWPEVMPAKLFGLQRHVHDMLQPEAMGLLGRIRGLMDRYPGRAALGEISSQPGAFERVVSCTEGLDRLHMAYTLRPLRGGFDWQTVTELLRDLHAAGEAGWPCWSFSNHDVERAASRWAPGGTPSPAFTRLLMAFLLSLRGSISLYQGEELGLPEADVREQDLRDPFGIAFWPEFRGRDGSRTPIPWESGAPHGGFSTGTPWLPVCAAQKPLAVDAQAADPAAPLHAYRQFIAWRRAQPALRLGSLDPMSLPEPLIGFVRTLREDQVAAVFNLSGEPVEVDLFGLGPVTLMAESGFDAALDGHRVMLPGHGAAFLSLTHAIQIVPSETAPGLLEGV